MKLMPNISLTEEQVRTLITRNKFDYGGEAVICHSANPNTLYKIFVSPVNREPVVMRKNKEIKITKLHELKLPNSTIPLSTISMDGVLVGYEMTNAIGYYPFYIPDLTKEETINMLQKAKSTLEHFALEDVTYGDVKNDNLLVNPKTGEIMFCDMDNVRVGTREIDVAGYELQWFHQCYGQIDEKADAYMHNLLTLEMLNYRYVQHVQDILEIIKSGDNPEGYEEQAKKTLQSMLNPQEFDGEYIIQYVKR